MRKLLIGIVITIMLFLANSVVNAGVSQWCSQYLSISAISSNVNFPKAVRNVSIEDEMWFIGVYGDQEFTIMLECSRPETPEAVIVGMSDGRYYSGDELRLQYTCYDVIGYYGIVIMQFPDGSYESTWFKINPAWKADAETILRLSKRTPQLTKPECDDHTIQEMVDLWWETIVIPDEMKKRSSQDRPSQFDEE